MWGLYSRGCRLIMKFLSAFVVVRKNGLDTVYLGIDSSSPFPKEKPIHELSSNLMIHTGGGYGVKWVRKNFPEIRKITKYNKETKKEKG